MRAVEKAKSGLVFREMRGNPVQNNSNFMLMEVVNEIHKICRRSKPARRSEIARRLISPRTVEGMLRKGQEFDVREAGIVNVVGQEWRNFAIGQPPVAFLGHSPPGAQMNLIYRNW